MRITNIGRKVEKMILAHLKTGAPTAGHCNQKPIV
jgi:hypothetical protein